jgi:hypothetical protein
MTVMPSSGHANECIVCGRPLDASYTAGGRAMMVHHPGIAEPCGYWIHENCRYLGDQAPYCNCGSGPAEEGLLPTDEYSSSDETEDSDEVVSYWHRDEAVDSDEAERVEFVSDEDSAYVWEPDEDKKEEEEEED